MYIYIYILLILLIRVKKTSAVESQISKVWTSRSEVVEQALNAIKSHIDSKDGRKRGEFLNHPSLTKVAFSDPFVRIRTYVRPRNPKEHVRQEPKRRLESNEEPSIATYRD